MTRRPRSCSSRSIGKSDHHVEGVNKVAKPFLALIPQPHWRSGDFKPERSISSATVDPRHPSVTAASQRPVAGLLLNVEVGDVDEVYAQLITGAGLPVLRDSRSEEWGQRHFITVDPNGVLNRRHHKHPALGRVRRAVQPLGGLVLTT